jgi:hypothetical protein
MSKFLDIASAMDSAPYLSAGQLQSIRDTHDDFHRAEAGHNLGKKVALYSLCNSQLEVFRQLPIQYGLVLRVNVSTMRSSKEMSALNE